jgi:branched-chain amino acid transport system ATP-binding protein
MSTILKVEDLCVAYGKVEAVQKVSLDVAEGAIVTVIGPNGAGKTTLLNAVMGLLPSRGRIDYKGEDITRRSIEARVADGLCLVPEKRELFGPMSVADNLLLGAYAWRRSGGGAERQTVLDEVYALFPRLKERRKQRAATLSGGERQMLAIGRALMSRPKLLMLDEPSLGLAPLIVREVLETVSALRRRGVSILIIEQNAHAALQIADYAYVLETGTMALEGPARELANNARVVETYLGLGKREAKPMSVATAKLD